MPARYRIASIPGDGIGMEVLPEAIKVLEALVPRFDISLEFEHFDWSCERYLETGAMMMLSWPSLRRCALRFVTCSVTPPAVA